MKGTIRSLAKKVVYFSVRDETAAKHLAERLISTQNDCIILPFIDHPGPLTKAILSRNFRSLTVCERDENIANKFKTYVHNECPDRNVNVYHEDIFDLMYRQYNDDAQTRCSNLVRETLSQSQKSLGRESREPLQVKFLVPLMKSKYESGFLRNIYYQVALRLGLCSKTYVHYYFLMSHRQYSYLSSEPSTNLSLYRSSTVLINTIFKIEVLGSYDLRDDFDITVRKIQKTSANNMKNYSKVHLVHLMPREDILSQFDPRFMAEFRFFVLQLMYSRTAPVRAFLLKWFDLSEESIAHIGISRSTRSGDLTKDQFLQLYRFIRDLPNYRNSTFLAAAKEVEESVQALDTDIENK